MGEIAVPGSQGRPLADALRDQERLDAVLDPDPLAHEVFALAVRALGILLRGRWHAKDAADLVIALMTRRQNPKQALRVEPIGLGPPRPSVDQDAGRLDDMVDHVVGEQEPVQPEAVAARLIAGDDFDRDACQRPRPSALGRDEGEQRRGVAGLHLVQHDFVATRQPDGGKPTRTAQFKCEVDGGLGGGKDRRHLRLHRLRGRHHPRVPAS